MNKQREMGRLKTYDPIKGYGFIQRERGKDVFVYFSDFVAKDCDAAVVVGSKVEFSIEANAKGPRARDVVILA